MEAPTAMEDSNSSVEIDPSHLISLNSSDELKHIQFSNSEELKQIQFSNSDELNKLAMAASLMSNGIIQQDLAAQVQGPYLAIKEQPQGKGFRFRYPCEGKSHGGLVGESSRRDKKTYPTVRVENYKGPAKIVASLVTYNETGTQPSKPHAHELLGKNSKNGHIEVELRGDSQMEVSFPNLGVQHATRRKVQEVLTARILEDTKIQRSMKTGLAKDAVLLTSDDEAIAKNEAQKTSKDMALNVVCLKFECYLKDNHGLYSIELEPVISNPIYDCKSIKASTLKICRMDKNSGCCTGNDEIFMLCDKVQKDDIEVRFYEEDDDGQCLWEGFGDFSPTDVHRQFAIVFKTPPYKDTSIQRDVVVAIQLRRKSDGETSDPKSYTYVSQPTDQEEVRRKRQKTIFPKEHGGPGSFFYQNGYSGGGGNQNGGGGGNFNPGMFDGSNSSQGMQDNCLSPQQMDYRQTPFNHSPQPNYNFTTSPGQEIKPEPEVIIPPSLQIIPDGEIKVEQMIETITTLAQNTSTNPFQPTYETFPQLPVTDVETQLDLYNPYNSCAMQQTYTSRFLSSRDGSANMDVVQNDQVDHHPHQQIHKPHMQEPKKPVKTELIELTPQVAKAPTEHSIVIDSGLGSEMKETEKRFSGMEIKEQGAQTWSEIKALQAENNEFKKSIVQLSQELSVAIQRYARTNEVRYILGPLRNLLTNLNEDGDNSLHLAIIQEKVEPLLALLDTIIKEDGLNQTNNLQQTPLHIAVITNQPDMVEALVRNGADLSVVDRHGNNAFHLAAKANSSGCIRAFNRYKEKVQGYNNHINKLNREGFSPLHLAVKYGQDLKCMRALVEGGCDVDIQDSGSGFTPLHHAVSQQSLAMAGYLLIDGNASSNLVSYDDISPLHIAAARNQLDIAALLLVCGASTDIECQEPIVGEQGMETDDDVEYCTPLHFALENEDMHKILEGVPLAEVRKHQQSQLSFTNASMNLEYLDVVTRRNLAKILDASGAWIQLVDKLGVNDPGLASSKSPTLELLAKLEMQNGSMDALVTSLQEIGREDAVQVIKKCLDCYKDILVL